MAKNTLKQERLPGTGTPPAAVERQERILNALGELHDALFETIEGLPAGDGTQSSITFRKRVKGDYIQITIQPGKGN